MHLAEMLLLPAGPLAVAGLLADPDFVSRCVRAGGATPERVEVTGSAAGAFRVSTRRAVPAEHLPTHLRGFVGTHLTVVEVTVWGAPDEEGARAGTVSIDVAGLPVQLRGTGTVVAHGDGSALRLSGDLRAGVPWVGEAIERAAAEAVRSWLRRIAQVADQVLRPGPHDDGAPRA